MVILGIIWKFILNNKYVQYLLILLALLMCLRWWGNRQWEKGFGQGKQQGVADTLKAKEESWKQKQSELDATQKKLEQDRVQLDADRKAVLQGRATLTSDLNRGVDEIRKSVEGLKPAVETVPASELDARIKHELLVLR